MTTVIIIPSSSKSVAAGPDGGVKASGGGVANASGGGVGMTKPGGGDPKTKPGGGDPKPKKRVEPAPGHVEEFLEPVPGAWDEWEKDKQGTATQHSHQQPGQCRVGSETHRATGGKSRCGGHHDEDEERAEAKQRNDQWARPAECARRHPGDRQVGGQRTAERDDPGD